MSHLSLDRLRAIARGEDPRDPEAEHLLDCEACRLAFDEAAGLAEVTAALVATPAPPQAALDAAERRLLAALEPPAPAPAARPRLRLVAPAALAAAALAAAWALWPRGVQVEVQASAGATLQSLSTEAGETVALDGEATFRVKPLPAGKRYRVRVRDDEVEVKGTTFSVKSGPDGLAAASVVEGVVEVRTACCGVHTLHAGQRWERPVAAVAPADPPASASAASAPPDAPASKPSAGVAPSALGAPGESADELRRRGLAAFDGGQYAQAAAALDRAAALDPQAPWSRDARTLGAAARLLGAPPSAIPAMGASVAAFDKAAQRAASAGDAARAAAAMLGAARHSQGEARSRRYCALRGTAGLGADAQAEIQRECR